MQIGFIGLGQMGRGMVSRLLEAGHSVVAWNRTRGAADALNHPGMKLAATPDDTLGSAIVISMLADDAALEQVWIANGLTLQMSPGALHLNMASVSLAMGQRLNALHHDAGVQYVAAPVFGRPEFAAQIGRAHV